MGVEFAHSLLMDCTCFFNGACRWKDSVLQCWCALGNGTTELLPGRQCGAGGLLFAAVMLPVVLCTSRGEVGREATPA